MVDSRILYLVKNVNFIANTVIREGVLGKWIAEAKEFAVRDNPDTDYLAYTIILKDESKAVGSVGCSYYEDLGEIGITCFIGAQYRNHGYAAEAVKEYTEYFFKHYDVQKLIATVRAENVPS